jgi:hypothetical protein
MSFLAHACAGTIGLRSNPADIVQEPRKVTLTGTVTYESTGRPARGVLIVTETEPEHRTGTDSAGHFRFDSLPYRSFFVQARAAGMIIERREVSVACSVAVTNAGGTRVVVPMRCVPGEQSLNFTLRPDIPW